MLQRESRYGLLRGGRDFHVRCCAHILNILVQDGLLIIRNGIAKIRDLYRHINSSPSRIQAFNGIATTFDLPEKAGLAVDTSNRWDSTFTMLEEALTYRAVLNSYASDSNEVAAPSDEEWTAAEGIGAFLKAFAEATKIVSADRKPTTHLFLQVVLCVRRALRDWHWQTSEYVKGMARSMSVKFDKYWKESELNHALIIATILDPTRNLDYLDFFYEKSCDHVDDIEINVESAKDVMKMYFQQYASQVKRSNETSITHDARINMGSPVLGKRQLDNEFVQYRSRRKAFREPKSELDTYWEEHVETSDKNWDILAWWKANTEKYPILSAMARDFLAVPLSTVSSESAFSCGGRILEDYRSSMKPEMVEALVCSKDWLTELPENEGKDPMVIVA